MEKVIGAIAEVEKIYTNPHQNNKLAINETVFRSVLADSYPLSIVNFFLGCGASFGPDGYIVYADSAWLNDPKAAADRLDG